MRNTLNFKKKAWGALLLICCGVAAAVVLAKAAQPVGCRQEDLAMIPDDSLMVMDTAQKTGQQEGEKAPEPEKWVCLTFDDGPSKNTEQVLDILKQEQVPATFFVIAAPNNEDYWPLIRREVEEGHQIALHSCTHEYKEIYQSPTAYWADIKALKERIAPYVPDVEALKWLRFPGGSTNTVSHRYGGSGIMKSLKAQANEKGYHYVDWNVCADDAVGGHPSADRILRNIIQDVGEQKNCVVLMHDTKATSTTVEALPDIIAWFREHGYQFCTVEQLQAKKEQQA